MHDFHKAVKIAPQERLTLVDSFSELVSLCFRPCELQARSAFTTTPCMETSWVCGLGPPHTHTHCFCVTGSTWSRGSYADKTYLFSLCLSVPVRDIRGTFCMLFGSAKGFASSLAAELTHKVNQLWKHKSNYSEKQCCWHFGGTHMDEGHGLFLVPFICSILSSLWQRHKIWIMDRHCIGVNGCLSSLVAQRTSQDWISLVNNKTVLAIYQHPPEGQISCQIWFVLWSWSDCDPVCHHFQLFLRNTFCCKKWQWQATKRQKYCFCWFGLLFTCPTKSQKILGSKVHRKLFQHVPLVWQLCLSETILEDCGYTGWVFGSPRLCMRGAAHQWGERHVSGWHAMVGLHITEWNGWSHVLWFIHDKDLVHGGGQTIVVEDSEWKNSTSEKTPNKTVFGVTTDVTFATDTPQATEGILCPFFLCIKNLVLYKFKLKTWSSSRNCHLLCPQRKKRNLQTLPQRKLDWFSKCQLDWPLVHNLLCRFSPY